MPRAKSLNGQVLLEMACSAAFGAFMVYLAVSGKYQNYVTPRMLPYFWFTAAVMALWTAAGWTRLFRPQHRMRSMHCLVLIVPLLLLALPHAPLGASDLSGNYNTGAFLPSAGTGGAAASSSVETESAVSSADTAAGLSDSTLTGLNNTDKTITVSNDQFYPWIVELYTNMDRYTGYTISMTGFVFHDPDYLADNEFAVSRLAMTCCTADLSPLGMVCVYDQALELESDSWITVTGSVVAGTYGGEPEPQIAVASIAPAEEVSGYIYP